MDALFVASVIAISSTGALSPGPLSIMTLALGIRGGWRVGFQVALGHMLFELPYVTLLTLLYGGLTNLLELTVVKYSLTIVVVVFNFLFAYLLINDALNVGSRRSSNIKFFSIRNPLLIGIVLTGLNPFFLIWWATVGMPLIEGMYRYGVVLGLSVMYPSHVWLDFIWLSFLAYTASKGAKYLSLRGYRVLLVILAVILMVFAVNMVFKTFLNTLLISL